LEQLQKYIHRKDAKSAEELFFHLPLILQKNRRTGRAVNDNLNLAMMYMA